MSPAKRAARQKADQASAMSADQGIDIPKDSDETTKGDGYTAGSVDERADSHLDGRADGQADRAMNDRIRERAYQIYCSRDGSGGNEMDDWLAAEREVRLGRSSTEGHGPSVLDTLSDNEQREVRR